MTEDPKYADRLDKLQTARWKLLLDVQAPYRRHLRGLKLGRTLELGCGIGRVLKMLDEAIGIDHNPKAVEISNSRGYTAFMPDDFAKSEYNKPLSFDSIVFSHVAEHLGVQESIKLLSQHIGLLKVDGRLVMLTPQEGAYKKDYTHVEFIDYPKHQAIIDGIGFETVKKYSFPFPRLIGRIFTYNEFISISKKPK